MELVDWADVVNGHFSLPSSLFLPSICEKADTPLAVSVMGADVFDPTRFRAIRPVADVANRHVLGGADAIVAPSEDMTDRVRQRFGLDPELIHYGIDDGAWPWSSRDVTDPIEILTVCRLVSRKNLDVAREAVARLSEFGVDVRWRVVGRGPLEPSLRSWAEEDDFLEYRGYVDDLDAELERAHLFFLPSEHEAFGMVFLEALASGLPVVTSDCGGQTDIVDERVGICTTAHSGPLSRAIQTVISGYPQYQSATEGYAERRFSQAKMVDEYEQLFRDVI